MARLFLHVGAHKTGTSFLQAFCHANRDRLEKAGLHYPNIGPNEAHHALAGAWIPTPDIPEGYFGRDGIEGLWKRLLSELVTRDDTVLLSAETFTRQFPAAVDMAGLAARLGGFEEVRVIYVMRRQVEMVQSLWLQIAKTRPAPNLRAYVERAIREGLAGGIPIDHQKVHAHLRKGFAAEQIVLVDHARLCRAPGGIVRAFLDLMGISVDLSNLTVPTGSAANISPDPLATFVARHLTGGPPPPADLIETVLPVLLREGINRTSLLTRREYGKLNQNFVAANRALVAGVQTVQPGFSFEEAPMPEHMIFRDDMSGQIWSEIARTIYLTGKGVPDRAGIRNSFRRILGMGRV